MIPGVLAAVAVLLIVFWATRWHWSKVAITVADPMVRAWLSSNVLQSSDSAYVLTASTIRVEESSRRIAIDSISVITDTQVNSRLARPHPVLAIRFVRCEITGIDLAGLAAGRGLHALHAGCDSVSMRERTVVAGGTRAAPDPQDADSNNFLRFQGKLDLPAALPYIGVDVVAFPHVHVGFDLLGSDGKRSSMTVDSLAVQLDSVRIDPKEPVAKRRPLFSHDISVRIDRFSGQLKDGAHLSLEHLYANLEDGSSRLDMIAYEPVPGHRADSLGFAAISARHVTLEGVRWRQFLLSGDVTVARLSIDTALVKIVEAKTPKDFQRLPRAPRRIETSLRAIGRAVRLDSLAIKAVTVVEAGATAADSATTTLRRVSLGHLDFGASEVSWNSDFPVGRVTLAVEGVMRKTSGMQTAIGRLMLDAGAQRMVIDSLRSAPEGNDSTFQARQPYRKARLSVVVSRAEGTGVNLAAFLRRGALRARMLAVRGLLLDIYLDKSRPDDPTIPVRRMPQAVIRALAMEIQLDSITGAGMVSYRERDVTAANPGTLTFGSLRLRGSNFSTDPKRMTDATPFRLVGDAKLMGAGAMHVEWEVPLLARDFTMHWRGSLGAMDPKAMNSFLPDAVGMRFNGGKFEQAEWSADVTQGMAIGKLAPRWVDLNVSLPGVARGDSSVIGGIARGFAKLAANAFGIRGDNTTTGGRQPLDGSIKHQWTSRETLPEFIWVQLRDPLLLILKK